MASRSDRSITVDARAAILGWPNLLVRELYSASLRHAGNRDMTLEDVLASWSTAVKRITARIVKQRGAGRGKAKRKAA